MWPGLKHLFARGLQQKPLNNKELWGSHSFRIQALWAFAFVQNTGKVCLSCLRLPVKLSRHIQERELGIKPHILATQLLETRTGNSELPSLHAFQT